MLKDRLEEWLLVLPDEVEGVAQRGEENEGMLESLIRAGVLPKYAFPVDVVKLSIPEEEEQEDLYESQDFYSGIPRDLQIALTEYAPVRKFCSGGSRKPISIAAPGSTIPPRSIPTMRRKRD